MNKKTIAIVGIIGVLAIFSAGCLKEVPVYTTVYEKVPVYETRYSGTLADEGLSSPSWSFKGVSRYTVAYTGKDLWGNLEYTFTLYYPSGASYIYEKINSYDINFYQELTGYRTESRQVQTGTKTVWWWE